MCGALRGASRGTSTAAKRDRMLAKGALGGVCRLITALLGWLEHLQAKIGTK